jgi:NADH:ubiquinone oxidoreductase subunit K
MAALKLAFIIVAIVLFCLAAVGVPTSRYNLIGAGLAFFAAAGLPI